MSETQINDKGFDTIPLEDIQSCRFCSQTTDETLIEVCQCVGALQLVHFSCLSSYIKKTRHLKCALCKGVFSGIKVESEPLGFWTFLKKQEEIVAQIVCFTFGFLFLYFILYLALIDYLLSDGLIHISLRILLIVPTVFYSILFTGLLVAAVVTLIAKYKQWRQRNHRIIVKQLTKKEEPKTVTKSNEFEDQKQKTSDDQKSEEKLNNERVAIDIEISQSTDNKTEQSVKVNTTGDNRNKVEIRQKE